MSQKQKEAVDLVEKGDNIFITGAAGTGKSHILRYLKKKYDYLHLTASTGISAINIGGQTLHSWAGLGLGNLPITEILKILFSARGVRTRKKLIMAKMLAIDEISMIPSYIFDLLNNILKIVRQNDSPFGGLQIILLGDFLQLPPVERENKEESKFCFESESWQEANIKYIELNDTFRQKEEKLITLLNNVRFGRLTGDDIKMLDSCKNKIDDNILPMDPIILGTHNYQIEKINSEKLIKLKTETKTYTAKFSGDEKKIDFLKRNCIAKEELIIKINSQVMMLKNTYSEDGIMNGSIGNVVAFGESGFPIVKFSNGKEIEISPAKWTIERFDEEIGEVVIEAEMLQIPLLLAWAITVHKSQGMTLEKVKCSLSKSFTEGQVYVALSRVKTLDGLFLDNFNIDGIMANEKVIEFYKKNIL
ncbi:MAG: AAA family ATPase [Rickettsiales bacterium]|nr:AAA family ATPase [Rickettsiales bacterium]